MKQEFYDAVVSNPIIAAVKDEDGLVKCLKSSDISVVFVLYGEVSNIAEIVEMIPSAAVYFAIKSTASTLLLNPATKSMCITAVFSAFLIFSTISAILLTSP